MWGLGLIGASKLILGGLVLTSIVGFGIYVKTLQHKVEVLEANSTKYEIAIRAHKDANVALQESVNQFAEQITSNQRLMNRLVEQQAANELEVTELRQKLAKHDLALLTKAKPKRIEKIINKATERAFEDINTLTGGLRDESE